MNNDFVSALFVLVAVLLVVVAPFRNDPVQTGLVLGAALVAAILSISTKDDYEE